MNAVCIDFETANRFRGSVCSVGYAIIDNGSITKTGSYYVKPHSDYYYFDPFNIMIHGITERDVKHAPEFDSIYLKLLSYFTESIIVAHNASFDISVLRHVLNLYEIPYPEVEYICSCKIAAKVWPGLQNYKLNTVCNHLAINFNHHVAEDDAIACAKVLLSAVKENNATTFKDLTTSIKMKSGRLFSDGYTPCSVKLPKTNSHVTKLKDLKPTTSVFDEEHNFYNKKLVFTGTLISMSRSEAAQKVVNMGGFVGDSITKDTDFLVMGIQDYTKLADGKESSKTKKAKRLINEGKDIQIIDEEDFLKML